MGNATEKGARLRLPGYYSILDGKRNSKYLDCKKNIISADLKAETDSLWHIHNQVIDGTLKFEYVPAGKAVSLLDLKIELAQRMLAGCAMCERKCGVDRSVGKKGACGVLGSKIASEFMHWGEETARTAWRYSSLDSYRKAARRAS